MVYKINTNYSVTFDDVLLSPAYSEIKPKDVITSTTLGNLKLHIPIISAAMDTVTENKMAINLSLNGGLGVIHKNNSIEEQVAEVTKVKKYESGMVVDPVTISVDAKLYHLIELKKNMMDTFLNLNIEICQIVLLNSFFF